MDVPIGKVVAHRGRRHDRIIECAQQLRAHRHSESAYTNLNPAPIAARSRRRDAARMKVDSFRQLAPSAASRPSSDVDHLRDVLRLLGADRSSLEPMARFPVALRRLEEGSTLAHEGAPLQSVYVVRCGSLKCVRTLEDGYAQVTALALPGDVLGFDGLHCGRHAATDVALESSSVYALPLSALRALREQCPVLDDAWQRALSRQLARATATADMLAAVASDVRLARFILSLSARAAALGWSSRRLRLSMCRRDVASLLGVAHETVSRSFTMMAEAGLLKVNNREVEILNHDQLQARARTTRRPSDISASVMAGRPLDTLNARPVLPTQWSGVRLAGASH